MKKKNLIILVSSTVILSALVFAYFYIKKISPEEAIKSIPITELNNPPEFAYHIFGNTKSPFVLPLGVLAFDGEVFVTDSDGNKVDVFDYNGKFLRAIGAMEGPGKLDHPYGITDFNGDIYVANGGKGVINIYSKAGEYKGAFKPKEEGKMSVPAQIVIKDNQIYYTDLAIKKVFVMTMEGKEVLSFGEEGDGEGQFSFPHGIAVGDDGSIFVADSGNNRVQKFDSKGKFIEYVGKNENSTGEMGTPRGLATDNRGNLYIVAGIENMIYVFDKDGELKFNFNKIEDGLSISLPNGIALDSNNRVFVTETNPARVAVFKY